MIKDVLLDLCIEIVLATLEQRILANSTTNTLFSKYVLDHCPIEKPLL
jgi:hypothetical protein